MEKWDFLGRKTQKKWDFLRGKMLKKWDFLGGGNAEKNGNFLGEAPGFWEFGNYLDLLEKFGNLAAVEFLAGLAVGG